jgi:uncharacterized protein YbcI
MEATQKPEGPPQPGAVSAQISREIVQLHSTQYGRGPTKAKTYVHEDYILCMLEDVFTAAERTLVKAGKTSEVEASRTAFQDAVRDEFIAIVEGASDLKVRAFLSMVNLDPELSAELFILEPSAVAFGADGDGHADGDGSVDGDGNGAVA